MSHVEECVCTGLSRSEEPTTPGFNTDLEIEMKTTLFALLFLGATAAFGQTATSTVSMQPQPIQIPSHEQHASQHAMQAEESLLISANGTYSATGERPLWEAGAKPAAEVPLGDVARSLRTQHATAKKAKKSLEK